MELSSLWKVDGNPDCVLHLQGSQYLMATYELDPETSVKTGSVALMDLNTQIKRLDFCKGILDLELYERGVFTISSDGTLDFIDLDSFECTSSFKLSEECGSFISINDKNLYASFVDGTVRIQDIPTQEIIRETKVNPYEIWSVCADNRFTLVPGVDGKLLVYDNTCEILYSKVPVHQSDIVSISVDDNHIYTGSFDGSLCTIDIRNFKKVNQVDFGGGVWRHWKLEHGFLCACMQEGFKLLNNDNIVGISSNSLAYGLAQVEDYYLGCSFYSKEIYQLKITNQV